jgi:photosynthetic reaction center cytochrome c subunit
MTPPPLPQPSLRPRWLFAALLALPLLTALGLAAAAAPPETPAPAAAPATAPAPSTAAPGAPPASPAAATLADGPTAGEKFKNIQVLSSMPASQMLPSMHLMRAALGVRCAFCHVTENNQYALDSKPEKETAREMLRMMMDLNRRYFDGRPVVTCNTCHNGREHPVSVPPIAQGQFADTTGDPAEPEGPKRPTAAELLDRYVEALGGRAALEAVETRVSRGTFLRSKTVDGGTPKARAVNRGQEDPIEIVQEAPNRVTVTVGPPNARMIQRFDGKAGTLESPDGQQRPLDAREAARLAVQANLHRELELRDRADKMRVSAQETIDGHEVWGVRATAPDGSRETLYFDAKTGLLRRRIALRPTVIGNDPEQTDYDDYRAVGKVKVPFVVKISYLDDNHLGTTRKFVEIVDNGAGAKKK